MEGRVNAGNKTPRPVGNVPVPRGTCRACPRPLPAGSLPILEKNVLGRDVEMRECALLAFLRAGLVSQPVRSCLLSPVQAGSQPWLRCPQVSHPRHEHPLKGVGDQTPSSGLPRAGPAASDSPGILVKTQILRSPAVPSASRLWSWAWGSVFFSRFSRSLQRALRWGSQPAVVHGYDRQRTLLAGMGGFPHVLCAS